MGMYTEIFYRGELIPDTPLPVVHLFNEMSRSTTTRLDVPDSSDADHPFFQSPRWRSVFCGVSAYFPTPPSSTMVFRKFGLGAPPALELAVHANLKNYDSEIEEFFNWIDQYTYGSVGKFMGYSLYESSNTPTLFYKKTEAF